MFVYWFAYTCRLILSTKSPRDHTAHVAAANGLTFLNAQNSMTDGSTGTVLATIHQLLEQDYVRVRQLLRRGDSATIVEQHIMAIDFRMMNLWYRVIRRVSPSHAQNALREMTSIVSCLASILGEGQAE